MRDAPRRGIKVYFDIISNHTADVIQYPEGAAPAYVSKDQYPYRTASRDTLFDDRDFAGARLPGARPPASRRAR